MRQSVQVTVRSLLLIGCRAPRALWLLAAGASLAIAAEPGQFVSGSLAGGQELQIAIPEPRQYHYLVVAENGVDLVIERPDLGSDAIANLPGRRWGHQVQVAWDLPASVDQLSLRPLLDQSPSGTYRYVWYRLESSDAAARSALESLSRAAELAPDRGHLATELTIERLQQAQGATFPWLDPAELWFRIGQLRSRSSDWEATQQAYDASLALLRSEPEADHGLAHVLDASSMNQMRMGKLRRATELSAEAAAAAERAGDVYQQAIISNNQCVIQRANGDMKAAAACLSNALIQYRRAGLVEHQSSVLINLAAAHTSLGDGHAAVRALEQAISLRGGEAGDDDKLARVAALAHLAQTQARLGRYQQALASGHEALAEAGLLGNANWQIQAARILARTHLALGQQQRAQILLESVAGGSQQASATALVRLQLELALLETDPAVRATRMAQLQQVAADAGDALTVARAQYYWATSGGPDLEAGAQLAALRGALASAQRQGAVGLQIRARQALAARLPAQATELLEEAMQLANQAQLPTEAYELTLAQARLAGERGDWSSARSLVVRADHLEDQLTLQMSPAQRDQFLRAQSGEQHFAVGLATAKAGLAPLARADWLLQRLLRGRSQLWRDQMRERLSGEQQAYRDAVEQLRFVSRGGADPDQDKGVDGVALEAALARVEAFESFSTGHRPLLRIEDLQKRLAPGQQLILLAAGEPGSVAAVVSPNSIRMIDLADARTLGAAAGSVRAGLSRQDPMGQKALARRMQTLANLLAEAFDSSDQDTQILVLSDSMLEAIPVEILAGWDPAGPGVRRSIARWGIAAGGDWFAKLAGAAAREHPLVLIYDATGGPVGGARAGLPNAALEVADIAGLANAPPALKLEGVSAAAWLADARPRRVGVIHVAAHAVNHPLISSQSVLALAGDDPAAEVSLGTLRPAALGADLAVLSGCSTGISAQGDYRQGFAEAFIGAGAERVMATLWPVDDAASAAFMTEFYRFLWDPEVSTPEDALAQTKRLFATSGQWRDPYWWAGYQLWRGSLGAELSGQLAQQR